MIEKTVYTEEAVKRGWLFIGENAKVSDSAVFIEPSEKIVVIGQGAEVGPGSIIGPGVSIHSDARVSSNVRIENGCQIGPNSFIGHGSVLRPFTIIGARCIIGHLTVFEGEDYIGEDTLIHAQCHITKGVVIGKKVFIAPLFVGANDPRMCHKRRHIIGYKQKAYTIEDGVRIAIGVSVLPGVTLGRNSVIGAHALVTKDVAPNTIVRGVPAEVVGEVSEAERL